jgi:pimeloyl-ACP methyl ester carboxylesterase/2-polyprenyl-6-methoxyphenol hydroxylase-like FAD-dependent oxidoreductase
VGNPGRAIVLGAGMAGLFAARVLAGSFNDVVLVDRDELPDSGEPRRKVPQGRHVHALLARGQVVIEELFPGITAELLAAGAAGGDVTGNVRWILGGKAMRQPKSGLDLVSADRPFIEQVVRARVRALPGVRILEQHDVLSLTHTDGRVTGAVVADAGGAITPMEAGLVVDATGRGSRTPVWLAEWGYQEPAEETVKIGLGYVTRHYDIPDSVMGSDVSNHIVASPESPRGAVCARVDGGRTVVTAYGMNGDYPSTEESDFTAFLKSLATQDVYEAVEQGKPIDDLVSYRFPANLRRRYEELASFPERLLVMGDAVCSFNPTYAQGMTVAAIEATVLRDHLVRPDGPQAEEFFADIARDAVDAPWDIAISTDLARSGQVDAADPAQRQTARLVEAATVHDEVAVAYARVVSLLDPPQALAKPEITALLDTVKVTTGGLTFDVQVAGPQDGVPVVLLHGWPHNYLSWTDVAPRLHQAGLRTIAPNQRGYSPGARPERVEDYALPLLAGDVLGILDELGVPAAHVVGHDWGAVVAWYLAAKHPNRIRTLTAVAFPHLDAYQHALRVDPEQQKSSVYIESLIAPGAAEAWLADDAAQLRALLQLHDNALTAEQQARYIEFHTRPGTFDAALNWYRAGTLLDGRSDMGQVMVPTTFIWSEDDASVSTLAAEKSGEYVTARYRLVTLRDKISHWQPQEVPDLVAEEILALVEDRREALPKTPA